MVRAPAWAPQFWTTWRYSVWPAARAAASASRAPAEQRLDQLVADRVERPVLPRRGDDRPPAAGRARLRRAATWAMPRSSSRASSPVPTTWNAKSLSIRTRTPVAVRRRAVGAAEEVVVDRLARRGRTDRDGRRDRRPWRPTSPVIGSLRSSNRPAAIDLSSPSSGAAEGSREGSARRRAAARSTDAVVGGAADSPRSAAIEVEIDAGHPARVDELEVGRGRP